MNILIRVDEAQSRQLIEYALPEISLNLFYVRSDRSMEHALKNSVIDMVIVEVAPREVTLSLERLRSIRRWAPTASLFCFSSVWSSSFDGYCRLLGAQSLIDSSKLSMEGLKIRVGRIFADADDKRYASNY